MQQIAIMLEDIQDLIKWAAARVVVVVDQWTVVLEIARKTPISIRSIWTACVEQVQDLV